MSITLEDFHKCCRCCLSTVPPFHPLFGLHLLRDMLNDIASLNVYMDDGYPSQVCRRCATKIGTASAFKTMVLKSHQIFTELLKESSATKAINNTIGIDISTNIKNLAECSIVEKEGEGIPTNYEIERVKSNKADKSKSLNIDREKLVGSIILKSEDNKNKINSNVSDGDVYVKAVEVHVKDTFVENNVQGYEEINNVENNQDQEGSEEEFKGEEDGSIASFLTPCKDQVQAQTLKCPFCMIRCDNTADMKLHLRTHDETCKVCGKTILRSNKTRHMRTHAEKSLRCELCGKAFADRSYYRQHMKRHENKPTPARKDCLCCYCGRKYKWKTSLYRHLHLHVGNSHDCEICDKKFTNPCYLKMHLVQHTSPYSKPFGCAQCGAKFTRSYSLRQHERDAHSARREEYGCSYCAKRFLNKSSLRRHETLNHLTDPKVYQCSDCGKQFDSRRSMALHLRVHKTSLNTDQENASQNTGNMEALNFDVEKVTVVKVEEYIVNSSVLNLVKQ